MNVRGFQLLAATAIAAGGAATAIATSEWWLLPIGAAASGLFLLLAPKRNVEPIPLSRALDSGHRQRAERLVKTGQRLREAFEKLPEVIREGLAVSSIQLSELTRKGVLLIEKHQELGNHLVQQDERSVRAELSRLAGMLRLSRDEIARERYSQAIAACEQQLKARGDLADGIARLDSEVSAIEASLAGLVTQLIRLQSTQARASIEGETGQIAQDLKALTSQVETVAESLESTFSENAKSRIARTR